VVVTVIKSTCLPGVSGKGESVRHHLERRTKKCPRSQGSVGKARKKENGRAPGKKAGDLDIDNARKDEVKRTEQLCQTEEEKR